MLGFVYSKGNVSIRAFVGGQEGKHAAKLQRSYLQLRVLAESIGGGRPKDWEQLSNTTAVVSK